MFISPIIPHHFSYFISPSLPTVCTPASISIPSELCLDEDSGLTFGEMKRILITSPNMFQLALPVKYSCPPSLSISISSYFGFGLIFARF